MDHKTQSSEQNLLLNKSMKTDDTQSFLNPSQDFNKLNEPLEFEQQTQQKSADDSNGWVSQPVRRVLFQIFIFALTFTNYAILHASRAIWSNSTSQIKKQYNYNSQDISFINSAFLACYATFGIFSGHLADKFQKNKFILCAYSIIGINVICVGCLQYMDNQQFFLYIILRMIDGTVQSIGWATNLAVLSNWFPKKGRGILIGFWASNANVGDIIGAQIFKAVIKAFPGQWGTVMIIIGSIIVFFAGFNFFFLIEYPSSKGIIIKEDSNIFQVKQEEKDLIEDNIENKKSISFIQALLIPGVLLFSISFFFIKYSMYGFYYWLPDYIQVELGYPETTSADIFSLFGVGGTVGCIVMGLLTDLLPYRSPAFIIGIFCGTMLTLALTLWNNNTVAVISALIFFLGLCLNGSTIVIAAIECDLGKQQVLKNNEKALATVSGIIDGIAGFGSILGQILIGVIKDWKGWRQTFLMLTIVTGLSGVPAFVFMYNEYKEWKQKRTEAKK